MAAKIHTIPLGVGNCFIVKDQGVIAIDSGGPKKVKDFEKSLEAASIKPEEVKLIIITHGHWDHIGSTADIKEMTGAKIAMHRREKDWLEKGLKPMPPGVTLWGGILSKLISALMVPFVTIKPAEVDIVLDDEELSLTEFGIAGRVIYTPGHSAGSVSILLESGEAFVGDLAMNAFPLRSSPGLPIFAEDMEAVEKSWRLLFEQGVQTVYPSHGDAFTIDIMQKALSQE